MVTAPFHDESFSFRFIHLSASTASRLRSSILNVELHSRRADVVALVLTEGTDLESLYRFLEREDLDPKNYSVWASVVSSSDHDGLTIPQYILELVRNTKCGIEFSFVAALGSDDENESANPETSEDRD